MKKTLTAFRRSLIPAAVLALTAGAVQAQSQVTIYGRVDLGFQYTDKVPVGAGDDKGYDIYNGGIRPSILGFKGTEDLGGGMTAFFNLEHHFDADTGVAGGGSGNFWRRQANVGLKSDWGTLTLGRQYSPAVLALLATDPRAIKEQMSGLYAFALNQVGGATANDLGIFLGNAISYSNAFGPFNFGAAYAFGEQPGDTSAGRIYSLGATYTGPVTVSGYYQRINFQAPVATDKFSDQAGIGVAMPFGPFSGKVQYIKSKVNDAVTGVKVSDTDTFAIGVDYAWTAGNTATVAYYHSDNDAIGDDKTGTLIISNDYAISKRTTLYAQVAFVDAKSGATGFTSVVSNAVVPDKTNTIFGVGISHNF